MRKKYIRKNLKEFYEIIEYHKGIFGIESTLIKNDYINIKDKIFNLINIFSLIDDEFNNNLTQKLLDDNICLINYFYNADVKYEIEEIYENYPQKNSINFEDFKKEFLKVLKEEKLRALKIMNTKLYFLDNLVWSRALKSHKISKFLKSFTSTHVYSTLEFLEETNKTFDSIIDFEYKNDLEPLKIKYKKDEIAFIKAIKSKQKSEISETLKRLISVKKSIKIFKDMRDDDIKYITKDVKFMIFNPHEIIINQGDTDDEIYLLLEGKCRVTSDGKTVGQIVKNQIFGEFTPITRFPRSATIRANENVKVIRFKLAFEFYKDDPYIFTQLYKNIIDELIEKIKSFNSKKF